MGLQNDERCFSFRNILIIDDQPFILDIFSQFLCDKGFNIQTADSTEMALEYLVSDKFNLILSDVCMKRGDFSSFLTFLKQPEGKYLSIPIIAVTGAPEAIQDKDKVHLAGVLEKPFTPDELLSAIHLVL